MYRGFRLQLGDFWLFGEDMRQRVAIWFVFLKKTCNYLGYEGKHSTAYKPLISSSSLKDQPQLKTLPLSV